MTVEQILFDFANNDPKKPVTRVTLYNYLRKFKIKPTSRNIHPVHYPADTPTRIRMKLGLLPARGAKFPTVKLAGARGTKSR